MCAVLPNLPTFFLSLFNFFRSSRVMHGTPSALASSQCFSSPRTHTENFGLGTYLSLEKYNSFYNSVAVHFRKIISKLPGSSFLRFSCPGQVDLPNFILRLIQGTKSVSWITQSQADYLFFSAAVRKINRCKKALPNSTSETLVS